MTILMRDARNIMTSIHGNILSEEIPFHDLIYADDTLLIDIHGGSLQYYGSDIGIGSSIWYAAQLEKGRNASSTMQRSAL